MPFYSATAMHIKPLSGSSKLELIFGKPQFLISDLLG